MSVMKFDFDRHAMNARFGNRLHARRDDFADRGGGQPEPPEGGWPHSRGRVGAAGVHA